MKNIIYVLFAFVVSNVLADEWYGPYVVETIEVTDDTVYFYPSSELPNPGSCINDNWVAFEEEGNLLDRVLSVGLAAQVSGSAVKFYIDFDDCHNTYIKATRIQIS